MFHQLANFISPLVSLARDGSEIVGGEKRISKIAKQVGNEKTAREKVGSGITTTSMVASEKVALIAREKVSSSITTTSMVASEEVAEVEVAREKVAEVASTGEVAIYPIRWIRAYCSAAITR